MIKIFGFGTLVLKESSLITCPNLQNFQPAMTKNAARVFGKVNLRAAYRGDVNWDEMKVASCFLEEKQGSQVMGVSYDIPENDWPNLRARELDYDCRQIDIFDLDGNPQGKALTFFGYPNDEKFLGMMSEGDQIYLTSRRKGYKDAIYRQGIYPAESYIDKCMNAFSHVDTRMMQNFLDNSFLADRTTTLRSYLKENYPELLE